MSLIKRHSLEEQPPLPVLKHTISDVTSDRKHKQTTLDYSRIQEVSESCSSEFFDLLGYDGFLNKLSENSSPSKDSAYQ